MQKAVQILVVGHRTGGHGRVAVASLVVADDAKALGQRLDLVIPHPAIAQTAVDQNERMSTARCVEGERTAVYLNNFRLVHLLSLRDTPRPPSPSVMLAASGLMVQSGSCAYFSSATRWRESGRRQSTIRLDAVAPGGDGEPRDLALLGRLPALSCRSHTGLVHAPGRALHARVPGNQGQPFAPRNLR